MVITDLGGLPKIEKAGINYGVTVPPAPQGVEPFLNVWTDSIGVFAGAEHPQAAMDFIDYQTTQGQKLRVQVNGEIPISTSVAETTNSADDQSGRHEALQLLNHARGFVFVPSRWDVYAPLFDAEDSILGDPSRDKPNSTLRRGRFSRTWIKPGQRGSRSPDCSPACLPRTV